MPGITKPATPTTSLVFTEIARMPSGIVGGSPPPEPSGASLDSVSGSFSATSTIAPRFRTSSILVNEPGTGFRCRPGHQLHVILRDDRAHGDRPRGDHGLQAGDLDLADRDGRHDAVDAEARQRLRRRARRSERARDAHYDSSLSSNDLPHDSIRIVERAANVIDDHDPPPSSPETGPRNR